MLSIIAILRAHAPMKLTCLCSLPTFTPARIQSRRPPLLNRRFTVMTKSHQEENLPDPRQQAVTYLLGIFAVAGQISLQETVFQTRADD